MKRQLLACVPILLGLGAGCALAPFEPSVGMDAGARDAGSGARLDGSQDAEVGADASTSSDSGAGDAGFDACAGPELCNGVDDDCDGTIDGFSEPCANACGETGARTCVDGAFGDCSAPDPDPEECNAIDDDCDGVVDETGCPCPVAPFEEHPYMFCSGTLRGWNDARDDCAAHGYVLATIDDEAEQTFVSSTALSLSPSSDAWIGLRRTLAGAFEWASGDPGGFFAWDVDEPASGSFDRCVAIQDGEGTGETTGLWGLKACNRDYSYVCEAPTP